MWSLIATSHCICSSVNSPPLDCWSLSHSVNRSSNGHADRTQRRVGVDRVTDQRHEVDDVFAVLAIGVDFVRMHRAEGLPEFEQRLRLGLVDVKRFDRQAAGEVFDLAVPQSGGIRAAVEDADGFDFVFVVSDKLTKSGDKCFGLLFGFGIKAGG